MIAAVRANRFRLPGRLKIGTLVALISLFSVLPVSAANIEPAEPMTLSTDDEASLIQTPQQAEVMLKDVNQLRIIKREQWLRREYDCYDLFLVNYCLDQVRAERRHVEQRFSRIEIRSRQVLRDAQALKVSERLARDGSFTRQEVGKEAGHSSMPEPVIGIAGADALFPTLEVGPHRTFSPKGREDQSPKREQQQARRQRSQQSP